MSGVYTSQSDRFLQTYASAARTHAQILARGAGAEDGQAAGYGLLPQDRTAIWSECPTIDDRARSPRHRAAHIWSYLQSALCGADVAVLLVLPILSYRAYRGEWLQRDGAIFIEGSCLLTLLGLSLAGAYRRPALQRPIIALNSLAMGGIGAVAAGLDFAFMSRWFGDISRMWIVVTALVVAICLTLTHLGMTVVADRLMRSGRLRERVALVGSGPMSRDILKKFGAASVPEVTVVGIFDDRKRRSPHCPGGQEVCGDTDSLLDYVRRFGIDRVILALPWSANDRILRLITKLRQAPVRIDVVPNTFVWELTSGLSHIHSVPVVTVANHRVDHQLDWSKRLEDVVLAGLMLVCFAPILLGIAIAIRLESPGPILYRQKRLGFNNEIFEILKFRSMYHGSLPDVGTRQATKNDPRVTRVGRFIRRTSLDELPQLLNVLHGTMSIAGPRPHALPTNDQFGHIVDEYFARHNVKPGITGWAQINGHRGETDTVDKMQRRVQCDVYYIENWSLMLDIKIVILTALRVWFQKTAY